VDALNKTLNKLTMLSLLFAFMLSLHALELNFVIPIGGYPLKIGLSNLVLVFVLFYFSFSETFILLILKLLTLFFFEPRYTSFSVLISASGGMLSLLGMILIKHIKKNGIILASIVGAILHNLGQWTAVLMISKILQLWIYLPFLVLLGAICGFLVGSLSHKIIQRLGILKKKHRY
jgi:heptaprenyl diphosphate synthase